MSVDIAEFEHFQFGADGPIDVTFALREFKVRTAYLVALRFVLLTVAC